MRAAIEVEGLRKTYGKVRALDGVDLEAPAGEVLGVLGPNGAGKTTAVRILTTLVAPDGGSARVAGLDVQRDAARVRANIGLAGQYAAVDEILTGHENLEMIGRLYRMPAARARARATELLEQFALTDAGGRAVKTYSGGMRRRLDLAGALVARPQVVFLDEPTTGLDPRSRLALWDVVEELTAGGTTILLTTQYLDEAERLARRIVVIDHGRVIAEGTSEELKAQVGGDRLELELEDPADAGLAVDALRPMLADGSAPERDGAQVVVPVATARGALADGIARLNEAGVRVADASLRRPTLDDVFLTLTGRTAEDDGAATTAEPEMEASTR
jgi:ABC-2 type transport system ATP-binding protein